MEKLTFLWKIIELNRKQSMTQSIRSFSIFSRHPVQLESPYQQQVQQLKEMPESTEGRMNLQSLLSLS